MKKIKIKYLFTITFFIIVSLNTFSQQLIENSLYLFNALNYNPGYSGTRDATTFSLVHRQQWTGIDGAPVSTFLTAHGPTHKDYLSWGLSLSNEEMGVTNVFSGFANLAYRIQLNEKRDFLSFGLRVGISNFNINTSLLEALDPEYIRNHDIKNQVQFNAGVGLYYYGVKHFLGFSALNLLEKSVLDNVDDSIPGFRTINHFYVTGGYVFDLSNNVKMKPYFLVKIAPGAPLGPEVHLDFLFGDRLWLGGMFRHEKTAGLKILYNINEKFRFGYAYDYIFHELSQFTGGSHEFMLSYDFEFIERKFKSPRYF